jgi:hypothetical protein
MIIPDMPQYSNHVKQKGREPFKKLAKRSQKGRVPKKSTLKGAEKYQSLLLVFFATLGNS